MANQTAAQKKAAEEAARKKALEDKKRSTGSELETRKPTALPAHLAGIEEDADAGTSKDMADNIVPLIYVLQALSPQCQRGAEQIQGAKAGDIWLRGTKTVIDGEIGMVVQWCFFAKFWIEWQPDRGGFVAQHNERPSGAVQVPDPKDERGKRKIWKTSGDKGANDLVESRSHVVILRDYEGIERPAAYVIPMSGSQHTSARGWMMMANNQIIPGSKPAKTAPLWACLYRMRTKFIDDGNYQWYGWDIENASEDGSTAWVGSRDDYDEGKKLHGDFSSGAKRADEASDMENHVGSGEDLDDDSKS